MEVQSPALPVRRQTPLDIKVLITWGLIAVAWLGHEYAPAQVSILWPIGILLISRSFLWPAWPEANRVVWRIFLGCQIAAIVSLGALIWFAWTAWLFMVAFLLASDAVLLQRGLALRRAKAGADV
jgi:hypothetical protein